MDETDEVVVDSADVRVWNVVGGVVSASEEETEGVTSEGFALSTVVPGEEEAEGYS